MFPLWDVAIAPVLQAAGTRRIVEIGALRGENTVQILEALGADSELHVIDPVPDFDPAEHERRFAGRYHFHRALSLEVLPDLPAMDAALVDGDHNWYTVYNELRLLAEGARRDGAPLPVMVLHDVLWPYGRRDLYYAPEQIPEEFRQPYAQRGMRPGNEGLNQRGGLNPSMCNALKEGGPRNGVMTALDDFIAELDEPVRLVVLPVYFGLAILVSEERLAQEPELGRVLDGLEGPDGRRQLLEIGEALRLKAMVFQHNVFFQKNEQLARARQRHLEVLKGSLLNEHYLDHEVRFAHLATGAPDAKVLRDPARHDQSAYRKALRARSGPGGPDDVAATSFVPYTAMGRPQLDHLERGLAGVLEDGVPGDLVECGTGRGGGAIFLRAYLDCVEVTDRNVWVADRFRAAPAPDLEPTLPRSGVAGFSSDLNLVRDGFARFGFLDERVKFLQGPPAVAGAGPEQVALLRIGRPASGDVTEILDALYDRVAPGGMVVVDGNAEGRAQAEAFCRRRGIAAPIEAVDSSALTWRRGADEPVGGTAPAVVAPHPPLAPPAPVEAIDLTVVVVLYNMRRESHRTLHALSRRYQEKIADLDYEVVVVENGSDPEERLGAELVHSFGPEFRYVDMGEQAEPSPVAALNRGIREGRGRAFALMIDGAHVLTPGVLRYGVAGLATYAPAIVVTQQWYVGPGQQGEAMDNGYDQAYEDRLFERISWPSDGYRLFEVGHFVGDRDWLDGVWESNCLFVERKTLEQVGCFDESFGVAGGGYANLEIYERLGSSPDINVTTILGEGSFHQVHGGTTTNQPDVEQRRSRVFGYGQEYAGLRGRAFKGPGKPIHYVGHIPGPAARRTKPRRLSTSVFTEAAAGANDGPATTPVPVPDELRWAFTEAVWRNLAWERTSWLGHRIRTAPTDLLAYQELVATVRPDWIVESSAGDAGRSLFLASICDLVGHGEVVVVGGDADGTLPDHPRLHHVPGDGDRPEVVAAVRDLVGGGRALLVLGACTSRARTVREFDAYADLVPVGSYVVVTDTIVNGHPVWPAFGPGPAEAMKNILAQHGEFVADTSLEKYSLSFDQGGFLKRVR